MRIEKKTLLETFSDFCFSLKILLRSDLRRVYVFAKTKRLIASFAEDNLLEPSGFRRRTIIRPLIPSPASATSVPLNFRQPFHVALISAPFVHLLRIGVTLISVNVSARAERVDFVLRQRTSTASTLIRDLRGFVNFPLLSLRLFVRQRALAILQHGYTRCPVKRAVALFRDASWFSVATIYKSIYQV